MTDSSARMQDDDTSKRVSIVKRDQEQQFCSWKSHYGAQKSTIIITSRERGDTLAELSILVRVCRCYCVLRLQEKEALVREQSSGPLEVFIICPQSADKTKTCSSSSFLELHVCVLCSFCSKTHTEVSCNSLRCR